MLIDTHCHLTHEKFTDLAKTLADAKKAGVEKVIIPTTNLGDAKLGVEIAKKFDQHALVGIHPEDLEMVENMNETLKVLSNFLNEDKVVGIGEIGLDFFFDKEKKTLNKQIELFRYQMELAAETGYPTAIHMRDAEKEMVEVLSGLKRIPKGQFHCFAGSSDFLDFALEKGFYVSFCGNITFKSAGKLRELLKKVPPERLLLETDSPYLSPEPVRGTTNTPANVKIVAEFIAQELGVDIQELAKITSYNTKCLYSLDI